MTTQAEVGIRIKVARERQRMTQADVGQRMSKKRSHAAISDIERGRTRIGIEELSEIADLLHLPICWFVQPLGMETKQVYSVPDLPGQEA